MAGSALLRPAAARSANGAELAPRRAAPRPPARPGGAALHSRQLLAVGEVGGLGGHAGDDCGAGWGAGVGG